MAPITLVAYLVMELFVKVPTGVRQADETVQRTRHTHAEELTFEYKNFWQQRDLKSALKQWRDLFARHSPPLKISRWHNLSICVFVMYEVLRNGLNWSRTTGSADLIRWNSRFWN